MFRIQGSGFRVQGSGKRNLSPVPCPLSPARGSILIIVLWALFFLASLAVALNRYIWPRLDLAGNLIRRAKIHYLAEAGVKRAILEIKYDEDTSYDALNEPWAGLAERLEETELGDGIFTVELIDEERKININKAPLLVIKNVFEIMGEAASQDASDLAAAVVDWRDEDDDPGEGGAEDGYYFVHKCAYPCKNAEFEILEELFLVKGMTQEVFNKVKDSITVHGGGAVNINTAEVPVLQALGMEEELIEKVIHFRNGYDGEEATADDNVFDDAGTIAKTLGEKEHMTGADNSRILKLVGDGLLSVGSDNFQGSSIGQLSNGRGSVKISFVFDRRKNAVTCWREE